WIVLSPGPLRTCARHHQLLWPALQSSLFQRWLPRRASREARRALDPLATAQISLATEQPLAGNSPLDRNTGPGFSRTPGAAFGALTEVCLGKARARLSPALGAFALDSENRNCRWRYFPPDRYRFATFAAASADPHH